MNQSDQDNWIPRTAGVLTIFISSIEILSVLYFLILILVDTFSDFRTSEIIDLLVAVALFMIISGIGYMGIRAGIASIKKMRWKFALVGAVLTGSLFIFSVCVMLYWLIINRYLDYTTGFVFLIFIIILTIVIGVLPMVFVLESKKMFNQTKTIQTEN